MIRGKTAYGCSGWKEGCDFVIPTDYKGMTLSPNQIQVLLQMHMLPYSVRIEDEQRLLILSKQGFIMDIDLPSADRQQRKKEDGRPAKRPTKK